MVDSEYNMEIYKFVKVSVRAVMRNSKIQEIRS